MRSATAASFVTALTLLPSALFAQITVTPDFVVEQVLTGLSEPTAAAFGPDGTLYIAEDGHDRIVRVDLEAGTYEPWVTGIPTPLAMAFAPPTRPVYTGGLYVVDGNGTAEGIFRVVIADVGARTFAPFYASTDPGEGAGFSIAFDADGRYGNEIFVVDSSGPDSIVRLRADGIRSGAWLAGENLAALGSGRGGDFGFSLYELRGNTLETTGGLYRRALGASAEPVVQGLALGNPSRMAMAPPGGCFGEFIYLTDISSNRLNRVSLGGTIEPVVTDLSLRDTLWGSWLTFAPAGDALYIVATGDDGAGRLLRLRPTDTTDADLDGVVDVCDVDGDGDGVADADDNCIGIDNPDQADDDADGVGDACETEDPGSGDGSGEADAGGRGGRGDTGGESGPEIRINEGGCASVRAPSIVPGLLGLFAWFAARRRRR
jgi:hypothetical protein